MGGAGFGVAKEDGAADAAVGAGDEDGFAGAVGLGDGVNFGVGVVVELACEGEDCHEVRRGRTDLWEGKKGSAYSLGREERIGRLWREFWFLAAAGSSLV